MSQKIYARISCPLSKPKRAALYVLGAIDMSVAMIRHQIIKHSIKVELDEQQSETREPSV